MARIRKLKENNELIYPATITNAVKDPETGEGLDEKLKELKTYLFAQPYVNIDVNDLFVRGYIPYDAIFNLDKIPVIDIDNIKCILLPVKNGDKITCTNIVGGYGKGRAWIKYAENGDVLSYADAGVILNEQITIDYDGYIVFNQNSSEEFTCVLENSLMSSNISSPYILALLKNIGALKQYLHPLIKVTEDNTINNMLLELVVSDSIPLDMIEDIVISDCYKLGSTYYNTVRLRGSDWTKDIYSKNFSSEQDAIDDIKNGKIVGTPSVGYAYFKSAGLKGQKIYKNPKFVRKPTRDYNPTINAYLNRLYIQGGDIKSGATVKILMFGNSFTQDSMSYVPFILKNIAPQINLTIGIAYIGGCPLVQHNVNLTGVPKELNGTIYNVKNYDYEKYINNAEKWVTIGSKSADEMLLDEDWDIITFQQNGEGAFADFATHFEPYIFEIQKQIFSKVKKSIKLGWVLTHGSYSTDSAILLDRWQKTMENTKKIQELTGNQIVFPYGTAIQNLKTTPLSKLGDGGNLLADIAHLHEGIGCLTAAYANALTIINASGLNMVSIIGEGTRPSKEWCTKVGVLAPNYGEKTNDVVGITEDNCYTAQVAAIMAVKDYTKVTDCNKFYTPNIMD